MVATIRLTTSVEVHDAADFLAAGLGIDRLFAGFVLAGDVLDADHQAGLAGDGHAVGQPAGAAAHALGEEVAAVGLGVGQQVADLGGEELDGREVAEGEVDAHVVVVDRLGQVDDRDAAAARRELLLEELELVGGLERVVAADGDQGVDAQRSTGRRRRSAAAPSARGRSGGRAPRRACPGLVRAVPIRMPWLLRERLQHLVGDVDVVAALDQGVVGRVLDQVRIAVEDAEHVDVVAQEGDGGGGDHGVGGRGGTAGKQDGRAANARFHLRRPG